MTMIIIIMMRNSNTEHVNSCAFVSESMHLLVKNPNAKVGTADLWHHNRHAIYPVGLTVYVDFALPPTNILLWFCRHVRMTDCDMRKFVVRGASVVPWW